VCRLGADAEPTEALTVTDPVPVEASGVVPTADGGAWTIDDSGNPAVLHRIRPDGTVHEVRVAGVDNVDWEELIAGEEPGVAWIADTGGNIGRRDEVLLHRVELPADDAVTEVEPRTVRVRYADDHHDVEAGYAADGSVFLVTKEAGEASILEVPVGRGDDLVAEWVGSFTPPGALKLVTGAALAPDGSAVLVRTYLGAWAYEVPAGRTVADALAEGEPCRIPVGTEAQGEAIGVLPDGRGWVTIGEGRHPTLATFRPDP